MISSTLILSLSFFSVSLDIAKNLGPVIVLPGPRWGWGVGYERHFYSSFLGKVTPKYSTIPMKRKYIATAHDDIPRVPVKKARTLSAPQQVAVAREVSRQMNKKTDFKRTVTRNTGTVIDASGLVFDLYASLTRGTAMENNFDGSSINPQSIRIRGQVQLALGDVFNDIRVVVLQWRDAGIPSPIGLYDFPGTPIAVQGTKYFTNKKNIKVLSDETYHMEANDQNAVTFETYIKGSRINQTWFQTTSNATSESDIA